MASPHAFNYTVDTTHEQALRWLRGRAGKAQPFFLYVAFTVPHAGGWGHAQSNPEQGAPVPTEGECAARTEWPEVERDHAAVVTYLDGKVGGRAYVHAGRAQARGEHARHLRQRQRRTPRGRTLSQLFFNSTGGLSGHKRSLYEGGVRSPTMARWPGTVPASVSPYRWAFWDVLPTFAELAGLRPPSGLDGVSIVPTLKGRSQPAHTLLYWLDVAWRGAGRAWGGGQTARRLARRAAGDGHADVRGAVGQSTSAPPTARRGGVRLRRWAAARSGYAVVSGDWKGIVPHCASDHRPSVADLRSMRVYHLPSDWAETADLARTAQGKRHALRLLGLVLEARLSCRCYQC